MERRETLIVCTQMILTRTGFTHVHLGMYIYEGDLRVNLFPLDMHYLTSNSQNITRQITQPES